MTDDTIPANVGIWHAIRLNALIQTYTIPYTAEQLQELNTHHYIIMATVFENVDEEIFEFAYKDAEEKAEELYKMNPSERQQNIIAMTAYAAALNERPENLRDFATLLLTIFHYFDSKIDDTFFESIEENENYNLTEKQTRLTQFFLLVGAELVLESNTTTEEELLIEFRRLHQYFYSQIQSSPFGDSDTDILLEYNMKFNKIKNRQMWAVVTIALLVNIIRQFDQTGVPGRQADALLTALLQRRIELR